MECEHTAVPVPPMIRPAADTLADVETAWLPVPDCVVWVCLPRSQWPNGGVYNKHTVKRITVMQIPQITSGKTKFTTHKFESQKDEQHCTYLQKPEARWASVHCCDVIERTCHGSVMQLITHGAVVTHNLSGNGDGNIQSLDSERDTGRCAETCSADSLCCRL